MSTYSKNSSRSTRREKPSSDDLRESLKREDRRESSRSSGGRVRNELSRRRADETDRVESRRAHSDSRRNSASSVGRRSTEDIRGSGRRKQRGRMEFARPDPGIWRGRGRGGNRAHHRARAQTSYGTNRLKEREAPLPPRVTLLPTPFLNDGRPQPQMDTPSPANHRFQRRPFPRGNNHSYRGSNWRGPHHRPPPRSPIRSWNPNAIPPRIIPAPRTQLLPTHPVDYFQRDVYSESDDNRSMASDATILLSEASVDGEKGGGHRISRGGVVDMGREEIIVVKQEIGEMLDAKRLERHTSPISDDDSQDVEMLDSGGLVVEEDGRTQIIPASPDVEEYHAERIEKAKLVIPDEVPAAAENVAVLTLLEKPVEMMALSKLDVGKRMPVCSDSDPEPRKSSEPETAVASGSGVILPSLPESAPVHVSRVTSPKAPSRDVEKAPSVPDHPFAFAISASYVSGPTNPKPSLLDRSVEPVAIVAPPLSSDSGETDTSPAETERPGSLDVTPRLTIDESVTTPCFSDISDDSPRMGDISMENVVLEGEQPLNDLKLTKPAMKASPGRPSSCPSLSGENGGVNLQRSASSAPSQPEPRSPTVIPTISSYCDGLTSFPLSTLKSYSFPLISTTLASLCPYPPPPTLASLTRDSSPFFPALDLFESVSSRVSSNACLTALEKLRLHLPSAILYADWVIVPNGTGNSLESQFLSQLKFFFTAYIRDSNVSTRISLLNLELALDVLRQSVLHVTELSARALTMGIGVLLVDLLFLPSNQESVLLEILRAICLKVQGSAGVCLRPVVEQLRKNNGGRVEFQRILALMELRLVLEKPSDNSESFLTSVIEKITEFRGVFLEGNNSGFDYQAAVYVCMESARFLKWYSQIFVQVLKDKNYALLKHCWDIMDLILDNEYGPVFLTSPRVEPYAKSIFSALSENPDLLENLLVTRKMAVALDTRAYVDLLHNSANRADILATLASLLFREESHSVAVNIISGKTCLRMLLEIMDKSRDMLEAYLIGMVVPALVYSGSRKAALLACFGGMVENLEGTFPSIILGRLKAVLTAWNRYQNKGKFFQWAMDALTREMAHNAKEKGEMILILLDACLHCLRHYLKSPQRLASIAKSGDVFGTILGYAPSVIGELSFSIDVLAVEPGFAESSLIMWQTIWINSATLYSAMVRAELVQAKPALQTLLWTVRCTGRWDLKISDEPRLKVQTEVALGLKEIVKESLSVGKIDDLLGLPLTDAILSTSYSLVDFGRPPDSTWVYLALMNRLHPSELDIKSENAEENWKALAFLDYQKLQQIICDGLCTDVHLESVEFCLWLWRYCQLGPSLADLAASALWSIGVSAIQDNLDSQIALRLLEKMAVVMKMDAVAKASLRLFNGYFADGDSEHNVLEVVMSSLGSASIFDQKSGRPVLLRLVLVVSGLLSSEAVSSATFLPSLLSVVIDRVKCDISVPLIVSIYPLLSTLCQSDLGVQALLNATMTFHLINRMFLVIAKYLVVFPENGLVVKFAEKLAHLFRGLKSTVDNAFPIDKRCKVVHRKLGVKGEDLRSLTGMVVAHTRDFDPSSPTYRIPLTVDPTKVCSADELEAGHENLRRFVAVFRKLETEFAQADDEKARFYQNGDALQYSSGSGGEGGSTHSHLQLHQVQTWLSVEDDLTLSEEAEMVKVLVNWKNRHSVTIAQSEIPSSSSV